MVALNIRCVYGDLTINHARFKHHFEKKILNCIHDRPVIWRKLFHSLTIAFLNVTTAYKLYIELSKSKIF